MTYFNIFLASSALQKLVNHDLPLPVSYKLYKAIKKLNVDIEFFRDKEAELKEKYKSEDSSAFNDEMNALLALTVDWNDAPIEMHVDDSINLSPADIEALAPFVVFVE